MALPLPWPTLSIFLGFDGKKHNRYATIVIHNAYLYIFPGPTTPPEAKGAAGGEQQLGRSGHTDMDQGRCQRVQGRQGSLFLISLPLFHVASLYSSVHVHSTRSAGKLTTPDAWIRRRLGFQVTYHRPMKSPHVRNEFCKIKNYAFLGTIYICIYCLRVKQTRRWIEATTISTGRLT